MSYATGYSRRPHYSNVGYGGSNYAPNYPPNNYQGNYQNYQGNYQQPVAYPPRRHNSYNYHPGSQVAYSNAMPYGTQYVTGGRDYYPSHSYSRHAPNVVVASGRSVGHQTTPYVTTSTSSRYRAEGSSGQPVPVVAGVSYRDEGIPLSTRIRRLFGLGPRRSSTHIGRSIHVKRWGVGLGRYGSRRHYTTADYGTSHRSQDTVYTL
ncbi:hypothetical protein K439DRAFT_1643111 [Ramaria rubella]|nr:hypothetical protein K439DRAFT_1643111 [Ramaria rubella]